MLNFMSENTGLTMWFSFLLLLLVIVIAQEIIRAIAKNSKHDYTKRNEWVESLEKSFGSTEKCIKFIEECKKLHEGENEKSKNNNININ